MKCVGYDEQFMYPLLPKIGTQTQNDADQGPGEGSVISGTPLTSRRTPRKRCRGQANREPTAVESDTEDDERSEGDADDADDFTYHCTGTKKRPRRTVKEIHC